MPGATASGCKTAHPRWSSWSPKRGENTNWWIWPLAWIQLTGGKATEQAVDFARRGASAEAPQTWDRLHTLAAVLAERGKLKEGAETLVKAMDLEDTLSARMEDWYVLGRIAELAGEAETAKGFYKRTGDDASVQLGEKSCLQAMAWTRTKALEGLDQLPSACPITRNAAGTGRPVWSRGRGQRAIDLAGSPGIRVADGHLDEEVLCRIQVALAVELMPVL